MVSPSGRSGEVGKIGGDGFVPILKLGDLLLGLGHGEFGAHAFDRQLLSGGNAIAHQIENFLRVRLLIAHQVEFVAHLGQLEIIRRGLDHHGVAHAIEHDLLLRGVLLRDAHLRAQLGIIERLLVRRREDRGHAAAGQQRQSVSERRAAADVDARQKCRGAVAGLALRHGVLQLRELQIAAVAHGEGDGFLQREGVCSGRVGQRRLLRASARSSRSPLHIRRLWES
jgi:hypothetical protein